MLLCISACHFNGNIAPSCVTKIISLRVWSPITSLLRRKKKSHYIAGADVGISCYVTTSLTVISSASVPGDAPDQVLGKSPILKLPTVELDGAAAVKGIQLFW